MEWIVKLVVLWVSFDIVTISTAWYVGSIVQARWPQWWERVIIGVEPHFEEVSFRHVN